MQHAGRTRLRSVQREPVHVLGPQIHGPEPRRGLVLYPASRPGGGVVRGGAERHRGRRQRHVGPLQRPLRPAHRRDPSCSPSASTPSPAGWLPARAATCTRTCRGRRGRARRRRPPTAPRGLGVPARARRPTSRDPRPGASPASRPTASSLPRPVCPALWREGPQPQSPSILWRRRLPYSPFCYNRERVDSFFF